MIEMKEFPNGKKPVKKPVTAEELNELIFDLVGLELTTDGVIIDDDLNMLISIKGKYMVRDESLLNENQPIILYDPVHNPSIMDRLFKHYLTKYNNENGTDTYSLASINSSVPNKSYLELIQTDGVTYKSGNYYNDNIKCADILLQLNCAIPNYNLHALDLELYEELLRLQAEKKRVKRGRKKKEEPTKPTEPVEFKSVTDWLDEANNLKNE